MRDAVIADLYSESFVGRTPGAGAYADDQVLIHVMKSGKWRFAQPHNRGDITVGPGQFLARYNGPPSQFEVQPRTTGKVLILPGSLLRPLIGDRQVVGSADSAEVRVLMAHANMIDATLDDLTPAGVRAARIALIELAKGLLGQGVDDSEPRPALALVQAARDIADSRLADPDRSPAMLARELNVSVRTLHRVFASAEESVATYIRNSRLEQARLELAAPSHLPSISELAAHWHFADSSHFIHAFKKRYGQTPAQYARSTHHTPPALDVPQPPDRPARCPQRSPSPSASP